MKVVARLEAPAIQTKIQELFGEQRDRLLRIGAAGKLLMGGEIDVVLEDAQIKARENAKVEIFCVTVANQCLSSSLAVIFGS